MTGSCACIAASFLGLLSASMVAKSTLPTSEETPSSARLTADVRAHQVLGRGQDVDTFALTLVAGQSVLLTLTPPPGMLYGLSVFQGMAGQGLAIQRQQGISGATVVRIPPPPTSATEVKVYIQIYSYNGQRSASPYSLSIQR